MPARPFGPGISALTILIIVLGFKTSKRSRKHETNLGGGAGREFEFRVGDVVEVNGVRWGNSK
eukprot:348113-Amorphochlora_amoeboformis.AAC.1